MTRALSLRMRLTLIILLPLMVVGIAAGLWQLDNARKTAAGVFDRSLLSAALAVANDVAISGGDALSARTRDILADTSGGRVFYHVYAPDGVIVAGYATPPVGILRADTVPAEPIYFDATYFGRPVSGVRLQNRTQIDGFTGIFTTTVWQDSAVRSSFVQDLVMRSLITISALIVSLGLIVWFGVHLGLRPLLDLEEAIEKRSSDELSPIRRAVPSEVEGIVQTLNGLFAQVSRSMTAQAEFISNAAHQLRNPIAGVLSLAEAVANAPDGKAAKHRAQDLLVAARETSDLTQKLLLLERAKAISPGSTHERIDMRPTLLRWLDEVQQSLPPHVALDSDIANDLGQIDGDPLMLHQAFGNVIDNALRHGGPDMTRVSVQATASSTTIRMTIADNGRGLPAPEIDSLFQRFQQLAPTSGSGLGLSIVRAVVEGHEGRVQIAAGNPGLVCRIDLPRVA